MNVIEIAVQRNRTVLSLLLLIFISGSLAYYSIPKEADPDVDIPYIFATATQSGIAPDDAETLLLRPLEQELRDIEGIKEMSATAWEGGASVFLEFNAGFDADAAVQDVREAVDKAKTEFPSAADEPSVTEINTSIFPILLVTLSGDLPERSLVRLARELRDEIETIPSVLKANISGDREEVVEVLVDKEVVESYALNADQIAALVGRSNRVIGAGNLDSGEARFPVKVPGLIENIDDILNLPVQVAGDAVVHFQDVTKVRQSFKDAETIARLNGEPAIAISITKRAGENIIDTVEAVKAKVDMVKQNWPANLNIAYSQDQSEFIETMLKDLENHVITAVILVMIIILGALGVRSAILVGISIPGSFLASILLIQLMGLTVNVVVLFALILSVGILVDGAIMVVEFAERKLEEGADRKSAFIAASKRMSAPIISATFTTISVFLPLLFWPGVVGEFMKYLPITVITTLSASLFMALIFVPTLGVLIRGKQQDERTETSDVALLEEGDLTLVKGPTKHYIRLLSWCLERPGPVLLFAAALMLGIWKSYAEFGRGLEFFPEVESDFAIVLVHARGNLSLEQKDEIMSDVEQRVFELKEDFDSVFTRTGMTGSLGMDVSEDVIGQVMLELKPWDERRTAEEIFKSIRDITADMPGIYIETRKPESGPPVGKPIQLQLSALNPDVLPQAIKDLEKVLQDVDGLVDLEDDLPLPGIEWEISVDRSQAAKFGLDVTAVGNAIQLVTHGFTIGSYRPFYADDEVDIVVRYPQNLRRIDELEKVRVVTSDGAFPISNFIEMSPKPKVSTIYRTEGKRTHTIKADVAAGILADDKTKEIKEKLRSVSLPDGVTIQFKGQDEEQKQAQAFLSQAFIFAIFLMAIILVTQFNSFYDAALVLFAVVMSTVGAFIGLLVTGQAFSIVMTGVGVIALAGVVVNDNIVLIDTFNHLKKKTPTIKDAVIRTGALRLRPVVLTTITTMLGLMPMVLQLNIDIVSREMAVGAPATQWWMSLATAVVFGLGFATVLTLVVTPCALFVRYGRSKTAISQLDRLPETR